MIRFFSYLSSSLRTRKFTTRILFSSILGCLLLCLPAKGQQPSETPLTNASIIRLVKAGFKEKTVIAIINSRPNHFKMDTEQLIQLKQNGVSENIILAMLSLDDSFPQQSGEEWANDSFFKGSNKNSTDADPNNTQSPGTDIFGSSSGSKSQTQQRGSRGENQNEGNTTGSATVRILRPSTEANGAPPKLERTPSLNNEGVIRLVEAGFSEGTIIKRIEESPVEFDLSPAKLDELHKRRVTDPVIAAMKAAMGDKDSGNKPDLPL